MKKGGSGMDRPEAVNDDGIVELYWARNEEAIGLTAKRYGRFVYSVCYNILRQRQDSEECRSTTYMKAWESIPPERPRNLKAFLAKLARAASIDRLRASMRQKRNGGAMESLDDLSDLLTDDYSVSDEVEARELGRLLNGFVRALPEEERILFVKRYYFGSPVRVISRDTGMPRSSVYAALASVKTKLKELLGKEGYLP